MSRCVKNREAQYNTHMTVRREDEAVFVATRILIISPQLNFTIAIKKALEALGGFEVTVTTTGQTALEQLQRAAFNVAIVDATLADIPIADLVLRLRATQPQIAILLGPQTADVERIARDLNLQGVVPIPTTARVLVPIIQDAVRQLFDDLPDTAKSPPIGPQGDTAKIPALGDDELDISRPLPPKEGDNPNKLEFILPDDNAAIRKFRQEVSDMGRQLEGEEIAMDIFRRLAAEEPPMPPLEDSGTLRDFRAVLDTSDPNAVAAMLDKEDEPVPTREPIAEPPAKPSQPIPAQVFLSVALDDTTPLDAFSIDDLFLTIDQQLAGNPLGIQPLPSWRAQEERFIREPDFLPEDLPDISSPLSATSEYSASTTQASKSQTITDQPGDLQTENVTPTQRSRPIQPPIQPTEAPAPPDTLPEAPALTSDSASIRPEFEYTASFPSLSAETLSPTEAEEHTADFERIAPPSETAAPADVAASPPPIKTPTDPRIAQMAVTLTQASLELTAEATLLAQGRQIIAYAGKMPFEDIEELRDTLEDDWSSEAGQSRIRFVTLPSSGRDYMVFSRESADGLTLAMIFAGTMPLRVIRKQSNRLLEALAATPAPPPAESAEPIAPPTAEVVTATPLLPPSDVGPLVGYTFVWLLADESQPLGDEAMQNILTGLDVYLTEKQWRIGELNVHEDYVYLRADVPGEQPSHQILRDLLQRSQELARAAQPEHEQASLWASSYLILTPARDLSVEEIQEFIAFVRR